MNSTLVYTAATPTVAQKHRDEVARMLAAARVAKAREAREARIATVAARIDRDLTTEAPEATRVRLKIIEWSYGKYRMTVAGKDAPRIIAGHLVDGDDIEYWPIVAE